MVDVREVITEAVPCNIVYGRPQAADAILCALSRAGFRIIGPDEVDQVTLEKAVLAAEERAEWVPLKAGDMASAIRATGRKA